MTKTPIAVVLSALIAWTPPSAAQQQLPDLGESAQADLSPAAERRVGESFVREFKLRDPAYLDDAEIEDYLRDLGNRLVSASGQANQEFEFFGVRDPTLNAFAMPGGFVGVHTGLILAAQTESELAGVLAHEIAHVTQRHIARMVSKQGQGNLIALAALLVAALAARSNAQLAQAAATAGAAATIQSQLNYSRDFEREADRFGLQTMEHAGLDVGGMAAFFERLQRSSRLYENNAPAYLRTHPLTTERIADMENRAHQLPYRQVPDSLAFQLVRAKLRVQAIAPRDAVEEFAAQLRERKYSSEAAARYGHAMALLQNRAAAAAAAEFGHLRTLGLQSPMIDALGAEIQWALGDRKGATDRYRLSLARFPGARALRYGLLEALLSSGDARSALQAAGEGLQGRSHDPKLWSYSARAHLALGNRALYHRAQGESYSAQGVLPAAVEQFLLAQKAADANFYEMSAIESRLRELKKRQSEEAKEAKQR